MFDTDVSTTTHEHCDLCNQPALRRRGVWIGDEFVRRGCYEQMHYECAERSTLSVDELDACAHNYELALEHDAIADCTLWAVVS